MNLFKELFRNKEKKTVQNFITMLLVGVVLIILSNSVLLKNKGEEEKISSGENVNTNQTQSDFSGILEEKLKNALMKVEGVGDVQVMITLENQGEIVVAEDKTIDKSETKEGEGVNLKQSLNSKEENKKILLESSKPLVLKEIQPKINGVLIIAKGGSDINIKNSIIKAVQALLNVEAHKIEVLKMK